jgi:hypothetical protein
MTGFQSKRASAHDKLKEQDMSKMAELAYDIEQLYIDGFNSRAIAEELGCPLEIVLGALAEMNVEDAEPFDPYATVNS